MASDGHSESTPTNGVVQSLLTDLYEVTMAYSYWKNGKQNCHAIFDVFFRKNPFEGEFTIFAGLGEVLKLLQNLKYTKSDIEYLKSILPTDTEEDFFNYLAESDGRGIKLYSVEEGTVVFPKEPLLRVEGPLPIVQLLETPILNLVNYASLVTTNAARFRIAAGEDKKLLEFGLRRAQGPDGGLSASKYCYAGGFDGTSNVLAGKLFDIPVSGTHAHSYIMTYTGLSDLVLRTLPLISKPEETVDFVTVCEKWKQKVFCCLTISNGQANEGEFAAFIAYSMSFPERFLALLDTYDVLKSGLPNFCAVALALNELGYKAIGIRIDSGDLAYLSNEIRAGFQLISKEFDVPWFADLTIVASNDIDEETLLSLNQQGHSIDTYGIGTHLVTCRKQPSLGVVYKLVQVDGLARIKLSHDVAKVTIPGQKLLCRLFGKDGHALLDLMLKGEEQIPEVNQRVLCRHPFEESKRANVVPAQVEVLQKLFFEDGKVCHPLPSLKDIKERVQTSLKSLRNDHKRALNPTPYKVSVSNNLYQFLHDLWLDNAPIGELS
ncbi:Nicotinate phosphoribosyltransferase [Holothuria leucospilota]|uniref:Nicotinate phosphoribosyltransferase n=1 Tax=Holothuria leucospilota TaxID=206669 RepID=A0A9Q0YCL4_HOLLE|nr:Nicotinate phosphoribosyltransferase [Holothuria leucospilota]